MKLKILILGALLTVVLTTILLVATSPAASSDALTLQPVSSTTTTRPTTTTSSPPTTTTSPPTTRPYVAPVTSPQTIPQPVGDSCFGFRGSCWDLQMRIHNCESSDYSVVNSIGAAGGYQYLRSTWNNYMGYLTADLAPVWVQDKRAGEDIARGRGQILSNWASSIHCWS